MGRVLVIFTSVLGGLGLGLAVGYLLLVVAAFSPQGAVITDFLVGAADGEPHYGFASVAIPFVLLLLHLWLRVNVGNILLERGEVDMAVKFASGRLGINLMRAAREVLVNRTVLMRAAMRAGEYDRALEVAAEGKLPRRGALEEVVRFQRWRLEAALRKENLVLAREIVQATWPFSLGGKSAAAFLACAGELAVRNADSGAWEDWRARAEFAHPGSERLVIASAFAASKFGTPADSKHAEILRKPLDWLRDVPGAAMEVHAALAEALLASGDEEAARSALVDTGDGDERARHVFARTLKRLPPKTA